jgi:hypothetical protein
MMPPLDHLNQLSGIFIRNEWHLGVNQIRFARKAGRQMPFAEKILRSFLPKRDFRSANAFHPQDQPIPRVVAELNRKNCRIRALRGEDQINAGIRPPTNSGLFLNSH